MLAALVARVLGRSRPAYGDGTNSAFMNPRGDLCIAEGLPIKTEIVRMADTWTCTIATGSAFTYVNAWPTTRAELVVYNGDPVKSLVIDTAFMVDVTTAAAAQAKSLLAQIAPPGAAAAPANDTAQLIYGRTGKSYSGNVKRAVANTAFALTNKWELIATVNTPNTASISTGCYVDLYGGWVIPPTAALCLAGVASTAAGTAIIGVTWHEVVLPIL